MVVADSLDSGLARAFSAEFIKDRAVGAVVAFAGGDQAAQHLDDAEMCFHAGHDFLLVTLGQDANLTARSPPIAPKIEQLVDLLDRKAQRSGERADGSYTNRVD